MANDIVAQCIIENCEYPQKKWGKGWCSSHWHRWQRYGDPLQGTLPPRPKAASISEYFWQRVDKTEGLGRDGDCWEWRDLDGKRPKWGYGVFTFQTQTWTTHRYAYYEAYGEHPADLFVCHRCDNPSCVRPEHLFLGTAKDNSHDCHQKNRARVGDEHWTRQKPQDVLCGERHGMTKLTAQEVRLIRQSTDTQAVIAKQFNIGTTQVHRIKNRLSWKHIDE